VVPCITTVLAIVGTSPPANAQDRKLLDVDVENVVSGGRWSTADGNGWYRAIVRAGGFEHVVSELTVEWIRERSADALESATADAVVARSIRVDECTGRLDDLGLAKRGATWRLTVRCIDTHGDAKPYRIVLALGTPGRYSKLQPK
jgi:hypothetical protein